jgi:GNAT superfamily N-acetyltransferase
MTMGQIEIRMAVRREIPALRELQERSLRVLGRRHYTATQIERFIARIGTMDDYLVSDRTYLVAQLEGEIVGCGGWTTRQPGYASHAHGEVHAPDPSRAKVRSVFVEPLAAGQGVGRRIMAGVESFLRMEGIRVAELGSTENGLAFYRSLGYRQLNAFHVDIGEGNGMRLIRMSKPLASANLDEPGAASMTA